MTVLVHEWVTGGGLAGAELPSSWAAEGRAMRRALAADFAALGSTRVVMTLDARLPAEPGPWTIARVGPGEEPRLFARLAARADWTVLIAPEAGGVLADRTGIVQRAGGRSLGSTAEGVELTGDKLRLGAWMRARGIASPECLRVAPAGGLPIGFPYPAVLKPIDGAGSVDTFVIEGAAAVPDEARRLTDALLQPLVPGAAMSATFLVGPAGRAALIAVGRQRMERLGARLAYRGGTLPAPSGTAATALRGAVEQVPGLRGLVGVDFVRDRSGTDTILEINPRPTTSCVALARVLPAGLLARAWLSVIRGQPAVDLGAIVQAQHPVTFDADGACREEASTSIGNGNGNGNGVLP